MVHMAVTRTRPEPHARIWWAATSVPVTRDGKAMGSPTVEVNKEIILHLQSQNSIFIINTCRVLNLQ